MTKKKAPPPRRKGQSGVDLPPNARQLRFIDEYVKDRNATAAAKRSGYSEKTANTIGPRFVGHYEDGRERFPLILAAINAKEAKHAESAGITAAGNMIELAEAKAMVFDAMRRCVDDELLAKLTAAYAKLLVPAMRSQGQLRDRMEVTGKDGGPIEAVSAVTVEIVSPKAVQA